MLDAVVAGAGFAGLRAARDLADEGVSVLLLEAQGPPRRAHLDAPVRRLGPPVEIGGSWFTPEHLEVPGELARYGLGYAHLRGAGGGALAHRAASCATGCRCRSASSVRSRRRLRRSPPTLRR